MKRTFGILFVVAFVSMLGAGACGGAQDQVQSRWTRRSRGCKTKQRKPYRGGARRWKSRYRRDRRKSKRL